CASWATEDPPSAAPPGGDSTAGGAPTSAAIRSSSSSIRTRRTSGPARLRAAETASDRMPSSSAAVSRSMSELSRWRSASSLVGDVIVRSLGARSTVGSVPTRCLRLHVLRPCRLEDRLQPLQSLLEGAYAPAILLSVLRRQPASLAGEVWIVAPPVDAHLPRLVGGRDEQTKLDGQQLDVDQPDRDVAGHDDP